MAPGRPALLVILLVWLSEHTTITKVATPLPLSALCGCACPHTYNTAAWQGFFFECAWHERVNCAGLDTSHFRHPTESHHDLSVTYNNVPRILMAAAAGIRFS